MTQRTLERPDTPEVAARREVVIKETISPSSVVAGRVLRAGWIGFTLFLLLWPTHNPTDEPFPAWELVLATAFWLALGPLFAGLGRRRAWSQPMSFWMAIAGFGLTAACGAHHPTSDWFAGVVAFPSLAILSRTGGARRFLNR